VEPSVRPSSAAAPTIPPARERAPQVASRRESAAPGTPVRLRLDLQQRARDNLRRHVLRAATRFGVLVVADLASFGVMRALIRAVRDDAVLGAWVASQAEALSPHGILNGWQYAAALFVSLIVLGCYGRGDQRRDTRRLFAACALATALPLWMTIWTRGLDVVLLQYVGENHGLAQPKNQKDYAVRMREFFDHYLKDAPAPDWWVNGVPRLKMEEHLKARQKKDEKKVAS